MARVGLLRQKQTNKQLMSLRSGSQGILSKLLSRSPQARLLAELTVYNPFCLKTRNQSVSVSHVSPYIPL